MTLSTLLFILIFLIGLYFYAKTSESKYITEMFTNNAGGTRCPNLLIQKGSRIYLYNSKIAKVPGVNPVEFENLEDYTEFLDWQRSQGIRCPVLYLQQSYDAQGNMTYKVRPSVSEPQGGLPSTILGQGQSQQPESIATSTGNLITEDEMNHNISTGPTPTLLVDATRNDPPYNKNSYPAYDQTSYYIGTKTPLDEMNTQEEHLLYSPNPMDENWGGADFTQNLVDTGYYKDNEVNIYVP
jgi:hypothetical protein